MPTAQARRRATKNAFQPYCWTSKERNTSIRCSKISDPSKKTFARPDRAASNTRGAAQPDEHSRPYKKAYHEDNNSLCNRETRGNSLKREKHRRDADQICHHDLYPLADGTSRRSGDVPITDLPSNKAPKESTKLQPRDLSAAAPASRTPFSPMR